ncbi:NAD(P)/FAD-dependent oxidoreductase [Jatrophihabitans fulvus]
MSVGSVVIAGASVAGLRVAEQLREGGFAGSVTLVGAEPHLPYDRPPLSKQVLWGSRAGQDLAFRSREELAALDIGVHVGVAATGWDGSALTLADGTALTADRLVIATGVSPRRLPSQPDHPAIGVLRTVDDAEWLVARLASGGTVAVVGGGFVGAEVASAARRLGCRTLMFEATARPLERALGAGAAALVGAAIAEAGVEFRGNVSVSDLVPDGDAVIVELTGGESVRVDTVVVGIGSTPASGWLGFDGSGGIPCDGRGRVVGLGNAYAIGDVAAWPDPFTGEPRRTEHWTNAGTHAAAVAADILGREPLPAEPDYFWTDQFGLKVQIIGRPDRADRTVVLRPVGGGVKKSVVLYLRQGRLTGCGLVSAARHLATATALVRDGADEQTARDAIGPAA